MHLARQLGAKIETVYGDDIPLQVAEFARLSGVSKIVIGRSVAAKKHLFSKPTLTEKLIAHAPNLDVHIIPDTTSAPVPYYAKKSKRIRRLVFSPADLAKSIGILLAASGIGFLFQKLGFAEANIITVYVLGVLLTSAITTHWIYSFISSIVSVCYLIFIYRSEIFIGSIRSGISSYLYYHVSCGTPDRFSCHTTQESCKTIRTGCISHQGFI